MATSGKEWRKAREEGIETLMPSGMTANLRPVEADFFLRVGHVPDALAPLINTIISGDSYKLEIPPVEQLEKGKEWIAFLNELCTYAFVTPKVVEAPQADDEISVDDICYLDKFSVYQKFSMPAHKLRAFCQAQIESMATMESGSGNGRTAIPNTAN